MTDGCKIPSRLCPSKPHSTKRHSSRGSSFGYPPESSIRSHHAREKAKLFELLAGKSIAKQRHALADLQLDIGIAKARARERAFPDEDSQCATSEVGESLTAGPTDSESVANVRPGTTYSVIYNQRQRRGLYKRQRPRLDRRRKCLTSQVCPGCLRLTI